MKLEWSMRSSSILGTSLASSERKPVSVGETNVLCQNVSKKSRCFHLLFFCLHFLLFGLWPYVSGWRFSRYSGFRALTCSVFPRCRTGPPPCGMRRWIRSQADPHTPVQSPYRTGIPSLFPPRSHRRSPGPYIPDTGST